MNIGIVVYSYSGHTLSVAMKLKEKLAEIGYMVTLAACRRENSHT